MPSEDHPIIDDTRKYLAIMLRRYQAADQKGRATLLDKIEAFTDMHRKSLTRLINIPTLLRRPRAKQREHVFELTRGMRQTPSAAWRATPGTPVWHATRVLVYIDTARWELSG